MLATTIRAAAVLLLGLATTCLGSPSALADEASARAELAKHGLQLRPAGLSVEKEAELREAFKSVTTHRKELLKATKTLAQGQAVNDQLRAQITHLQRQQVEYSTQLAQVNANDPNNVALNNKLVAALNAINGQQKLAAHKEQEFEEELAKLRQAWNEARETYLQLVLDMRTIANDIEVQYEQLAKNKEVEAALQELGNAAGKELSLVPSSSLASALKRLDSLEKDVLSASIELRRERNTLWVPVQINGKYSQEMVVDSGASLICLPLAVATKLGATPTDDDPVVTLVMADGREIEGKLVKLDEVRVGQFTVHNVEAAVLGEDAVRAEPLLGMSYLGNFKFELDAKAGTLTMVDIEGANPEKEAPKAKPKRGRRTN